MPHASEKLAIAIECESIEDDLYGVARLIRKLLEQLAARPELVRTHRFILYFNRQIPTDPLLDSPLFEKKLVGLPRFGLPGSFSIYYYILLPIQLWLDRVDATYWPNYMLPIIAPRPSLVMLTEDVWDAMHEPKLALRYRAAYLIFCTWAARTATRIAAISRSSAAALAAVAGIAPSRIVVNELAVDPPRLDVFGEAGGARTVTPMPGPYVLFVGQAFERRHLRETIAAFERIASDDKELRLVAIGPDKYDPACVAALVAQTNRRLGRPAVQHIDRVSDEDLARFYAGASALVYVSDLEAFGLPPLEALSYGVVPVVADVAVNREIYGDRAFYVALPATPEAIGQGMAAALSDTEKAQGIRAAASDIVARYTWSAHADRFLDIITQLA